MKTCDICGEAGTNDIFGDKQVHSVTIGTSVEVMQVRMRTPGDAQDAPSVMPCEVELCSGCMETVNASIAEHCRAKFNLTTRRELPGQ